MRNQESVHRARVLAFWKKHGLLATKEAFGVSRRTLFRWQRASQRGTLVPGNRAPKKRRRRETSSRVCDFIVAERSKHPRLGKEKLQSMLKAQGYAYSVSTVGRIVGDLKKRGRLKQRADMKLNAVSGRLHEYKKPRVRKKHRPQGTDCLELDTVVRFVCGTRRYVITAIDTKTKFAFAGAYAKHSSTTASDLLNRYKDVSPVPVAPVQTDNGSEFSDHFEKACKKLNLTHYHTYPHCPKMNGVVERFNRTLSEDFIASNKYLLRDDIPAFNLKLAEWLLWYNSERPHASLGQVSPLRYITNRLTQGECHMLWTRTGVCLIRSDGVESGRYPII